MQQKKVLLIIANKGYQPLEYGNPRKELEHAGIFVHVASNASGVATAFPEELITKNPRYAALKAKYPDYISCSIDLPLSEVNPSCYDGIFIVGGPGAMELLDNNLTYTIMQQAATLGILFGAICISPRILAKAGLLTNKKATGWDEDNQLSSLFATHNICYVHEPVVVDGTIITATGPAAATDFGKKIVSMLL